MKTESTGSFWQEIVVPNGEYDGKWSGYEATIVLSGHVVKFNVKSGVRGLNIPVTVTVTNGQATIRVKNEPS